MKLMCGSNEMVRATNRRGYVCKDCGNFISDAMMEDIVQPLLQKFDCLRLPRLSNEITIEKE